MSTYTSDMPAVREAEVQLAPAGEPAKAPAVEKTSHAKPPRRKRPLLAAGLAVVLLGGAGAAYYGLSGISATSAVLANARWYTVARQDLDVTFTRNGELEAVRNIEIVNRVGGRRTITYLIPEGTSVKRGDLLVQLADQDLRDEIASLELEVEGARAELINAREQLEIQLSQNAADLQEVELQYTLAKLELEKYENGVYPQALTDADTALEMAKITLSNRQEDLRNTRALFAKGFVTAAKVKEDELAVKQAENEVAKAESAYNLLVKYEYKMESTSRREKLSDAESDLERQKAQNKANKAAKEADVRNKEQTLAAKEQQLAERRQELADCRITAPEPGMVVYNQGRRDDDVIAEGLDVRHRQTLLKLPDVTQMKAVVRVPENRASSVKPGMRAIVTKNVAGFDPIGGTVSKVSVLADSGEWWNRDTREYPVDVILDHTPDALKPGVKVDVEIYIDRLKDVLTVPLQSVYTVGQQQFVFVRTGEEVRPREVKLGRMNSTHVHVVEGLSEGDRVLELEVGQGRELLEQAGIVVKGGNERPADDKVARRDAPGGEATATEGEEATPIQTQTPSSEDSGAATPAPASDSASAAPSETPTATPGSASATADTGSADK